MINSVFTILAIMALALLFVLLKSNKKQQELIKKESESIEELRNRKNSY